MTIADAQKEIRYRYAGGFYGQLVSAAVWIASAALAELTSTRAAIACLVLGGFFIFPITELLVRANKGPSLSEGNGLRWLGMQVAFVLPLSMPLLLPVTRYNPVLFYPAMMVLVGAHYVPFVFLYGMRAFIAIAAALLGGGVFLAMSGIQRFSAGAWYTAAVLVIFAFAARAIVRGEARVAPVSDRQNGPAPQSPRSLSNSR